MRIRREDRLWVSAGIALKVGGESGVVSIDRGTDFLGIISGDHADTKKTDLVTQSCCRGASC